MTREGGLVGSQGRELRGPDARLPPGSKQYSAAIAFTLALFSHLVNHVNMRLQAELEEGDSPVPAFQSDGAGARGGGRPGPCPAVPGPP